MRSYNAQNELTGVGSGSLQYDADGNLINDGQGNTYTYDAWNRLVKVAGNGVVTTYSYDALGRRITESHTVAGTTTTADLYYSSNWQVLQEDIHVGGSPVSQRFQYVWSPVYVNAMVLRDQFSVATNGHATLINRLYVEQDANWNVIALVDGTPGSATKGKVVECFVYEPFGQVAALAANWTPLTGSKGPAGSLLNDTYGWRYLFQGGAV